MNPIDFQMYKVRGKSCGGVINSVSYGLYDAIWDTVRAPVNSFWTEIALPIELKLRAIIYKQMMTNAHEKIENESG